MGSIGNSSPANSTSSIYIEERNFDKTDYYIFKDGSLYRNVAAGLIKENKRPYRVAGNYNIYVDSFPRAALPYSNYYIADKITGEVYRAEILQGMGDGKQFIQRLVEELKRRK